MKKAIVKTLKKADSKYGIPGKYIVVDDDGNLLINAIYFYYNLARKNASLYNKNQLSIKDILNIVHE